MLKTCVIAALGWCALRSATAAPVAETVLSLANVPRPARQSIEARAANGRLEQIVRVSEEGENSYDVELVRAGQSCSFTIAESGELLAEEVSLSQVPAAVRRAIRDRLGKSELESVTKVFDEGEVTYTVSSLQGGRTREFTLSESGELLSLQVFPVELSAELQAAIKKAAGSGEAGDIFKLTEDDEVSYELDITGNGRTRTVTFDADAALVAEEEPVGLRDTPAPVQKALTAQMAGGKLLALHRITEDGEVTYEAKILRAGKRQSVTVASNGKAMN